MTCLTKTVGSNFDIAVNSHDESHPHAVRVAEAYVRNLSSATEDEGTWWDHAKELQQTPGVIITLYT